MSVRNWMNLVESLNEVVSLLETFDQPLPLTYNHERSIKLKADTPNAQCVSVYDAIIDGIELEFVEWRYKFAWEVHFNNRTSGFRLDVVGSVLKGSGMLRILATAISILEKRLKKGNPIRLYAENPELRRLYDRVFGMLNTTRYGGKILRIDIKTFEPPRGKPLPAVLMQIDPREFPFENKSIEECLCTMQTATTHAMLNKDG